MSEVDQRGAKSCSLVTAVTRGVHQMEYSELKGTEKQVNWAKAIRKDRLKIWQGGVGDRCNRCRVQALRADQGHHDRCHREGCHVAVLDPDLAVGNIASPTPAPDFYFRLTLASPWATTCTDNRSSRTLASPRDNDLTAPDSLT